MPRSQARARRLPTRTPDYESRLTRARVALKRARIAALLIVAPSDIRYLTGFSGEASTAILTHKDLVLISDFRFQEELEPLKDRCEILIRKGAMLEAQAQAVAKLKLRAIALQPEHLTLRQHAELRDVLGASRLRDAEGLMYAVRLTKDAAEIACIERAARIQQEAVLATLPSIKPGLRERDIAARLEFEMKSRGADALSFDTIVAAKANGSKPHYRAGDEKTAKGKTLLIDWGARVEGYCADMTRVFALGSWPAKIREIYRIVLDAHLAAIDAVKPGASCAAVDAAARDIIINAGYGAQFGHGTGHGVGLDIHEAPRLFTTTNQPLQEGMVITIEPGIYLPGVGGVRIEDDILVTPKGARNLCTLPKNIEWATLHG